MQETNMSRGRTWSHNETESLIDIWSEEKMTKLLTFPNKTHKAFLLVSQRMQERGFNRSAHQCHMKVKRLRQHYFKVRGSMRSGGGERQNSEWYNELDAILGSGAACAPRNVVESFKEEEEEEEEEEEKKAEVSCSATPTEWAECSVRLEDINSGGGTVRGNQPKDRPEARDSDSTTSSVSPSYQQVSSVLRRPIPGAHHRKKKTQQDQFHTFLDNYLELRRDTEEGDQRRHEEEMAAFRQFMAAQQEAEERRFQALQAQQQANHQLLLQLIGVLSKTVMSRTNPPSEEVTDSSATDAQPMENHPTVTMALQTSSATPHSVNKQNKE